MYRAICRLDTANHSFALRSPTRLSSSVTGNQLGILWLFRRRNLQKGGYWTEWTEKDEKHQIFISLQLPDFRRSGAP
jgi:hypothetical protein